MMRLALVTALLGGCIIQPDTGDDTYYPPPDNTGWGSGYGGSGGSTGYGCHADTECGTGYVCARSGECAVASGVRVVHVNWTVHDVAASATSCANAVNLDITFTDTSLGQFGFTPVPCKAGRYTIDKMLLRYTSASLSRAGDFNGGATGTFDAMGNVNLDLPY